MTPPDAELYRGKPPFDELFYLAANKSLSQSGIFTPGGNPKYFVQINSVRLIEPRFGASMTASVDARWTLSAPLPSRALIWQAAIETYGTASVKDEPYGPNRAQLAIRRAAIANIGEAMAAIQRSIPAPIMNAETPANN